MEEIFYAQLFHILGADAKAREISLKVAKNTPKKDKKDKSFDSKHFFLALSWFYKLESTKYDTFDNKEIDDRMIIFDECITQIEGCMKNYLVDNFGFEHQYIDAQQDDFFEDIFIFHIYKVIVNKLMEIYNHFKGYLGKKIR